MTAFTITEINDVMSSASPVHPRVSPAEITAPTRPVLVRPIGLEVLSYGELMAASPDPPPMLSDALRLPKVGLVVLAGPPKVGKTVLAQQTGVVVGSDSQTLLGGHVNHGPVLYVAEEGSLEGTRYRLSRQVAALAVSEPAFSLAHRKRLRLDDRSSVAQLRDRVATLGPALVIVDPLNRLHGKDENRPSEMTPVMDALSAIAYDFGLCMVAIHHLSKPSAERRGSIWDRFRGAGAIRSSTDGNLAMEESGKAGIHVVGEFRDAEPLDLFLALDREQLIFHELDVPRAIGKIDPDALAAFVGDSRGVTATAVMDHFGVKSKATALAALEGHRDLESVLGSRGQRTYFSLGPFNERSNTTERSPFTHLYR